MKKMNCFIGFILSGYIICPLYTATHAFNSLNKSLFINEKYVCKVKYFKKCLVLGIHERGFAHVWWRDRNKWYDASEHEYGTCI